MDEAGQLYVPLEVEHSAGGGEGIEEEKGKVIKTKRTNPKVAPDGATMCSFWGGSLKKKRKIHGEGMLLVPHA